MHESHLDYDSSNPDDWSSNEESSEPNKECFKNEQKVAQNEIIDKFIILLSRMTR